LIWGSGALEFSRQRRGKPRKQTSCRGCVNVTWMATKRGTMLLIEWGEVKSAIITSKGNIGEVKRGNRKIANCTKYKHVESIVARATLLIILSVKVFELQVPMSPMSKISLGGIWGNEMKITDEISSLSKFLLQLIYPIAGWTIGKNYLRNHGLEQERFWSENSIVG